MRQPVPAYLIICIYTYPIIFYHLKITFNLSSYFLFIHTFIYLSIYFLFFLPVYAFVSIYLSIHLSVILSIYLCTYPSFISSSIYLSIYTSKATEPSGVRIDRPASGRQHDAAQVGPGASQVYAQS